MAGGFRVDLGALDQAADGVNGTIDMVSQQPVGDIPFIFMDQLTHVFDPAAPWESVRPHAVVNEDGRKIQEWRVSLDDVREFYARAGQAPGRSQ